MDNKTTPRPYEGTEKYIFISYSHKDTDRVMPIVESLMSNGFRVWYDDGISPGTEWPEVIAQHLNDCELFIAFLSNSYMDSFNCKREIDFAVRKRKTFLAVFLEETELSLGVEMQISTVQSVDYYKTTPEIFISSFCNFDVVKDSGCRANIEAVKETAQANIKAANAAATSSGKTAGKSAGKKPAKILIPVILGVLALLGIAGAVIGINVSKNNQKNAKRVNMRAVELSDMTVTERVLRKDVKGKDIRSVKITNCEFSIRDHSVWSDIVNDKVTQITITDSKLSDEDAKAILESATGLKTLDFSGNELTDVSFSTNPQLQNVDLSNNKIRHIAKSNLENLTTLKLEDNELTDLSFLETAIHLQTLTADRNKLEGVDTLKNCAVLKTVSLSDNSINDVSSLAASKAFLQELNLSYNKISDVECIGQMPELKKISVDHNNIASLDLTGATKLSYLSARENALDFVGGDFEQLTYLDVANNKLYGDYYFQSSTKLKKGFFENNNLFELWLPGAQYASGQFSVYNNPLTKLVIGAEDTSFEIYVSYNDDIGPALENKTFRLLHLLDCPYEHRVNYETAWGKFYVDFPEKNEVVEKVEGLRKSIN